MGQKFRIVGWVAAGAVAGALTTVSVQTLARGALAPLPLEELQQLAAVFGRIKTDYVEPVDEKKLIRDAIAGMVSGLDPHSQYLDKEAFKESNESISGRFVGLGIEVSMEDGYVKVVSPIEGSPAFRAGLKSGDLITKIDDTPVKGLTLNEAVKRMRGEAATKVTVTIYRKDENRGFPVTLIREEIRSRSVRAKIFEPGYAWLRVSIFQDQTTEEVARKLEELLKEEPQLKGLVLDLRNDPGGLLDAAIGVSAAFLPSNAVVVSTDGQITDSKAVFKAHPQNYLRRSQSDPLRRLPAVFKSIPMVVLVNEGSASASEIVAGALQDHKRATVMGAQTFGKGSVQTVRPLSETTGLKLTTARYFTPAGRSIQLKGITPDVLVDDTEEGSPFAALRVREADFERHLNNPQGAASQARDPAREKAREEARQRAEEELRKPPSERRIPEFGSEKDFPLLQAINHLKGRPVMVSKSSTSTDKPASN